jgi:hypothetical protein
MICASQWELLMRVGRLAAVSAAAIGIAAVAAEAGQAMTACTLFTKDELRPFIRNRVFDLLEPQENRVGNGWSCSFAGVTMQLDPFPIGVIQSAASKDKANYETISGLGDQAYYHWNARAEAAEIAIRVGQRVFTAQVDDDPQGGESRDSVKARAIGIARAAVAKLR